MMYEYVAQYGQVRVKRGYLAEFRAKGSAESLESSGGAELVDFPGNLLRDELPFEVSSKLAAILWYIISGLHVQCSCFPVRIRPSSGFELDRLLPRTGRAWLSPITAEPFGTPFCLGFTAVMLCATKHKPQFLTRYCRESQKLTTLAIKVVVVLLER